MEVTVCREGCSREERSRREGPLASGVAGGNREGEERRASGVGGGGPRDPGGRATPEPSLRILGISSIARYILMFLD